MKKISIITLFLLIGITAKAQNHTDALRYSTEELSGTARFKAMSGAFGALGGDMSAVNINPAGSTFFSSSEINFSLNNKNQTLDIGFLDRKAKSNKNDFDVSQFGVVFAIPNVSPTLKKISVAFNYQKTKNFDNDKFTYEAYNTKGLDNYFQNYLLKGNGGNPFAYGLFARGTNFQTSSEGGQRAIGEYYATLGKQKGYAAQMAYLGLLSKLVTPTATSTTNVGYTALGKDQERLQRYRIERSGYVNKANINFATQVGDFIALGMNLNIHNINEKAMYSLRDNDFKGISSLTYANHKQYINTTGEGFSLQLGGIAKLTENIRVGASYQSPVWYRMKEESRQVLYGTVKGIPKNVNYDVELINRYGDEIWYEREYKFRTPAQWTASAAYLIKKRAILSVDYVHSSYNNLKFRSNNLAAENAVIQSELGDTSTLRIGGELRFPFLLFKDDPKSINYFSVRAGYRYEQSPYRRTIATVGDLKGYAMGVGVTLGGVRIDASYDIAKQTNTFALYESILTDKATLETQNNNFAVTLTWTLF